MNEPTEWIDRLICGDALQVLRKMPSEFVDAVLTDPPYFYDKLDNEWKLERVEKRLPSQRVVKHLPPGMKFDPEQGRQFYRWFLRVAQELLRVLKPGGLFFCFSSPRLYHRLAAAVEDAGFWVRDCFIWLYLQSQPKAMGRAMRSVRTSWVLRPQPVMRATTVSSLPMIPCSTSFLSTAIVTPPAVSVKMPSVSA